MSATKATRKPYEGKVEDLARLIAGRVKVLTHLIATSPNPKRRADAEARLRAAYAATEPKTWSWSTVAAALIDAVDRPAKHLHRGTISEDAATRRALQEIDGVMNDDYAPPELAGRKPARATVLACLRDERPKPGRPKNGNAWAKHRLELLAELGVSGATSTGAVNKLIARKRRK